jgi:hypothetical protein
VWKKFNIILSALFIIFISVFGILLLVMPDRDFSDNENRTLQQLPTLSLSKIIDGSFMTEIEDYVIDQFPFRDSWMAANSVIKSSILKKDINGVYLGDDGHLLEVFDQIDTNLYNRQIQAINRFSQYWENSDINFYLAMVPNSVCVLEDKLPAFAPVRDQEEYINSLYSSVSDTLLTKITLSQELKAHSDEYIYYRTDHHWTSLGAYYGYTAISSKMGLTPSALDDYTITTVSEDFKGTFFSKGNFPVEADTIQRFDKSTPVTLTAWGDDGVKTDSIYFDSALEIKDKYTYFLGGNPAHYTVETSADSGKTLVMIKDSYSHSLLPFFLEHYSEIHLIDLRYTNKNVSQIIDEISPDDVLLVFNVMTFSTDTNITKLGLLPQS